MKEVACICGERLVFLDPEVKVKTCPNCGMSVYQEAPEVSTLTLAGSKHGKRLSKDTVTMILSVTAVVVVAAALVGVMAGRQKALGRANELVAQADRAAAARDYDAAAEGYARALEIYWLWFAGNDTIGPVQDALERAKQHNVPPQQTVAADDADKGLLGIPLEELAKQAYGDSPENWDKTFSRDYANHTVVLRGKVEERSGNPYKVSALTISYRVFSASGQEVEMSFDPAFFERYRLKAGTDCIVRAWLSKMYLDKGAPGEAGHWVLVADGLKSSLVTDVSFLRGLGWKIDDEIENLAASQAGLSPSY